MYKEKKCLKCGNNFTPKSGNSLYCGSQLNKNGCSYSKHTHRKANPEKWRKHFVKILSKRNIHCLKCGNKIDLIKWYNNHIKTGKKICDNCRKIPRYILPKNGISRLKLRFIVLHRDNFTCRYCGRKPPETILQIDHIYPKSKGGVDKEENYITSCRECNIGKSDFILN